MTPSVGGGGGEGCIFSGITQVNRGKLAQHFGKLHAE